MKESQGSMLSGMSPAKIFVFGIVEGILVLCTIGFFIMLSLYLGGDSNAVAKAPNGNNGNGAPTAAPAANGTISVAAVDKDVDHIRGNEDAEITIVEYSDLECPFCQRHHDTMKQLMAEYGDKVRWVYRHLPLDSLHRQAREEALATECAGEQGRFWELTDLIFETTTSNDGLDLSKLPEYAAQAGVSDIDQFNECLASKKYASKVQRDEQDAASAGGTGTPHTVIVGPDGELVPIKGAQPLSAIEGALAQFLN